MWPALTLLLFAALLATHVYWRWRLKREWELNSSARNQLKQQHEDAALKAKSAQEALLNSLVEGLLVLDQNGQIQLANRAFLGLFHLSPDIKGKMLLETLRSHELAQLLQSLENEGRVVGCELRLTQPVERCLEVNGVALSADASGQKGAVLVFHDLTRIKKLERTRQEFVANVSHELRTPLSLIKGYTETLLGGAKDDPGISAKFLLTIDRNAERLRALIEDLLTISELETGQMRLDYQPCNLLSLTAKVLAELQSRASARQIQLVNAVPELTVFADSLRLEQVLTNLLDNALKYGKPGGTVRVEARSVQAERAEICVRDDGPGIPEEALERVFERFYRVDKARSREQGGTGLGLSIVKHIVQSHGGRVWVESSPGTGAAFFFTMPLGDAPRIVAQTGSGTRASSAPPQDLARNPNQIPSPSRPEDSI